VWGPGATGATSFVLIDVGGVQLEEVANLLELAPVAAEAIQQLGRNGSGNKNQMPSQRSGPYVEGTQKWHCSPQENLRCNKVNRHLSTRMRSTFLSCEKLICSYATGLVVLAFNAPREHPTRLAP
jgi:hypothetical protein